MGADWLISDSAEEACLDLRHAVGYSSESRWNCYGDVESWVDGKD